MLDTPVSGGIVGAEKATLTFMVGGETVALEAARPFLSAMGKSIVHCGGTGSGQVRRSVLRSTDKFLATCRRERCLFKYGR